MTDSDPIPYGRQWIDDDDVEAVSRCVRDPFLTQGPRVAEFEAALCAQTGAKHAVAVTSGTAALHIGALALGARPGTVGLTSAITFLASANALRYAGADAAFADVDPETALTTPGRLEAAAEELARQGRSPSILVPVDMCGQPVDLEGIHALAERIGAKVLHDAAHSLGGALEVQGRALPVGGTGLADATILSFHPVKHITTAEGGAVLTDDDEVHRKLLELRNHGMHKRSEEFHRDLDDPFVGPWYYEQASLGFNYRLPDVACALGLSQLKKLEHFVERRAELARLYDEAIASDALLSKAITPLRRIEGRRHAWHLYVVRLLAGDGEALSDTAARRKALYLSLRDEGVLTQVHYVPVPWQPYHEASFVPEGGLPGAEAYYASCLSLPMFPAMTDADVQRVVAALRRCLG